MAPSAPNFGRVVPKIWPPKPRIERQTDLLVGGRRWGPALPSPLLYVRPWVGSPPKYICIIYLFRLFNLYKANLSTISLKSALRIP